MNSLLVIIIALMIASLFSVLLIKGNVLTGGQTSPEPQQSSFVMAPVADGT